MDAEQFLAVKKKNVNIVKQCMDTGIINLDGFTFWEGTTTNQLCFDTVLSKYSDILGCTAVGAVPSLKKKGADGYMWYWQGGVNYLTDVEVKVCGVNQEDLALGIRGGLYYNPAHLDNSSSKRSITSHFEGKFDTVNMTSSTFKSKNRDTYLVMIDRTENKLIGSYKMPGKQVLANLNRRKNNESAIGLKLSAFQQDGFRWHSTLWEPEHFDKWEKRMKKTVRRYLKY